MNIILLEKRSNLKNHRPNLALARFSTLHKEQGDQVFHVILDSKTKLPGIVPDKIYISIIFSWDVPFFVDLIKKIMRSYPNLCKYDIIIGGIAPYYMGDYIVQHTGIIPHKGCSQELDCIKPDPSFYDDDSYIFSMRSCPNNCSYCIVPKIEDRQYIIPNWKSQINMHAKNVVICDNNLLAAPKEHKYNVFNYLTEIAHKDGTRIEGTRKLRSVSLDGGLDWRRINQENINLIKEIKFSKIRVAFDDVRYEKGFDDAILQLLEAFPKKSNRNIHESIEAYVLYNCPDTHDTIEDTLYRCYKLFHHYHIYPYLMRYQPYNTLQYKSYVSPNWTEEDCIDIGRWSNCRYVMMKVPSFKYYYGRKEDGTCLSNCSDYQQAILKSIKPFPTKLDYTKPYKDNCTMIKSEITERLEIMKRINDTFQQIELAV